MWDCWVRDSATATGRAANPDPSGWTLTEHLLALAVDELRVANWQRSKHGQKGHNRPKPISPLMRRRGTRIGKTDRRPAEVAAMLARLGPTKRKPVVEPLPPQSPLDRQIAQLETDLGIGHVEDHPDLE